MRRNAGLRPALDAVDRKDDQKRSDQHDNGDRGGVGITKLGQPDHDQQIVDLTAVAGNYVMVAMLLAMAEETVPPGKEEPFKVGEK